MRGNGSDRYNETEKVLFLEPDLELDRAIRNVQDCKRLESDCRVRPGSSVRLIVNVMRESTCYD